MKRAVRTGVPVRVTSLTSTIPRRFGDVDPAAGLGRGDLVGLGARARVDHDLDPVALHGRLRGEDPRC